MAIFFEMVGKIEKEHGKRYRKLLENIKNNTVFEKPSKVLRECSNCGHTIDSYKAPEPCPFCQYLKAYFFMKASNF